MELLRHAGHAHRRSLPVTRAVAALILLLWLPAATAAASISGLVKDASGAVVPAAEVEIRSTAGTILAVIQTGETGRFEWAATLAPGYFQLRIRAGGFDTTEILAYANGEGSPLEITLQPRSVFTRVVVTTTRGSTEESASSAHVAAVKDSTDLLGRPIATLGQILDSDPGVQLQQSTYGQVSPFLRGLTGYQVLNVVDGIRFNNATFRSGPNQYLAYLDPTQAERVEAVLGPAGSQYGSDSLGGTIQVVTPEVRFQNPGDWSIHGDFAVGGASADFSRYGCARVSLANDKLFWLGAISGRQHNDLRAGRGHDSHNVFHRLFGMPLEDIRGLIGNRQQDSGFRQYGVQAKFAARTRPDQLITLHYQRGNQDRVRGYKDLLGGLGRLVSDFDPQRLDWFYARYEKTGLGPLDSLTGTFSLNSQTDGSVRQNLLFSDPVTRDRNRVDAFGYAGQGALHLGRRMAASFGGEVYDERIASEREVFYPSTGALNRPRPLYPDGSRYRNLGLYSQASVALSGKLRAAGAVRWSAVQFKSRANASYGIPDSSQWFRDVTFNASLRWQWTEALGLHGVVSRGFRAPNLNDLGALGLNDLGYEIPAAETVPAGALLSTDAGEAALSRGRPVRNLAAESLMNYELGLSLSTHRVSARLQFFDAELYDPVVRRTLLFPAIDVPVQLAGLAVAPIAPTDAQRAQGVVAVATSVDPRAVKSFVNDGRSRYYGTEALASLAVSTNWSVQANYAYILGRELDPNRNVRRLPPQAAALTLRYASSGRKPWLELALATAGKQDRLSGGDRDDERIGASYRRRDIADFFNGDRVRAYRNGEIFLPTGETLRQIQDRVLPIGGVVNGVQVVNDTTRVPLYLSTAGWARLSVRSGMQIGEYWRITGAVENILDRNYRHHGSGIDAAGISAYLTARLSF